MNQREKILAAAVLCLIGLWGLRAVYGRYVRGQDQRQSQMQAAQDELAKLQHSLRRGERSVRNMQRWQERSLPADADRAPLFVQGLATGEDQGRRTQGRNHHARWSFELVCWV